MFSVKKRKKKKKKSKKSIPKYQPLMLLCRSPSHGINFQRWWAFFSASSPLDFYQLLFSLYNFGWKVKCERCIYNVPKKGKLTVARKKEIIKGTKTYNHSLMLYNFASLVWDISVLLIVWIIVLSCLCSSVSLTGSLAVKIIAGSMGCEEFKANEEEDQRWI